MLKVIEIENIKGIGYKKFDLDIIPNKPSLLVAPNGFGKSSIATAFNSMNRNRINLQEEDYHKEDDSKSPKIRLQLKKPDGNIVDLEATEDNNSIINEIEYFVINNRIKPKGIGSLYGTASARLEIKNITLVNTIPDNVSFEYSYRKTKKIFGQNCKVLPNLDNGVLNNLMLIKNISLDYQPFRRANGKRDRKKIKQICETVNNQSGTADELLKWIDSNQLEFLKQIKYVSDVGDLLNKYDLNFNFECQNYLAAIQLVWLYNSDDNRFRRACKYSSYLLEKNKYENMLLHFNCTWKNVRASESGGKLIVKFPKAMHISNGERDILTFISMLFKARQKLNKESNILIIDEVFDYLDEANLTAAQYYITKFIDDFKIEDKYIYPIILTHLNPDYFKNYAFKKQKIYYLEKFDIDVDPHFVRLLRNRNDPIIKDDIDKHLLHFHPDEINKREEFRSLGLPELWGEGKKFYQFLYDEVEKYLNNEGFCPFAVCGAVRVKIENVAYNKLQTNESRTNFLNTHGTRKKLKKAEDLGVFSPEAYYLLGIIYNEGMHWKEHQDNTSPIASKLENKVIKKLIIEVMKI